MGAGADEWVNVGFLVCGSFVTVCLFSEGGS